MNLSRAPYEKCFVTLGASYDHRGGILVFPSGRVLRRPSWPSLGHCVDLTETSFTGETRLPAGLSLGGNSPGLLDFLLRDALRGASLIGSNSLMDRTAIRKWAIRSSRHHRRSFRSESDQRRSFVVTPVGFDSCSGM